MTFNLDEWSRSPARRRFLYYDPYLTYSNPDNDCFIDPKGIPHSELNPDTDALFSLGKEAFKHLTNGGGCSREEFDEGYAGYWAYLDELRETICEMYSQGNLVLTTDKEQRLSFDIKKIDDTQVVSIIWQICPAFLNKARTDNEIKDVYQEFFLFHALREIDDAMIAVALNSRDAVVAAIDAANALSNAVAIASGDKQLAEARKRLGYEAAIEKLRRDPKQREKTFVRECWDEWQENPGNYKSKAAFARDMLSKCEHLESAKKIEDWCRQWTAEGKG